MLTLQEERFSWMEALKLGSTASSQPTDITSHFEHAQQPSYQALQAHSENEDSQMHATSTLPDDHDREDRESRSVGITDVIYDEILPKPPIQKSILSGTTNFGYEDLPELHYDDLNLDNDRALPTTTNTTISPTDRQEMEEIYEKLGKILGKCAPNIPDTTFPCSVSHDQQTSESHLSMSNHQPTTLPNPIFGTDILQQATNPTSMNPTSIERPVINPLNRSPTGTLELPDLNSSFTEVSVAPQESIPVVPPRPVETEQNLASHSSFTQAPKVSPNLQQGSIKQMTSSSGYENLNYYKEVEQHNNTKSIKLSTTVEQNSRSPVPKPRKFRAGKPKSAEGTSSIDSPSKQGKCP